MLEQKDSNYDDSSLDIDFVTHLKEDHLNVNV